MFYFFIHFYFSADDPSLAFIENEHLLSALTESVLTIDPRYNCKVEILYGDQVTDVIRKTYVRTYV